MAVALLSGSCSKDIPEETTPSEGNRVVFTLGGATRAAGDNDTYYSLAAKDEEKQIDELLAVVFTEDGAYYKTFDANYDAGQKTASFDLGKNGTYDVYFVANADETLSGSLRTLTDQNSDSQVTAEDLSALLVTQEVGKKDAQDAWYPFLMFSDNAKRIVSTHGSITDGGLITMRRLAVRFDLVNAAEGVTINSVKLINRAKQSRLGASNDMSFSTPGDLYEEKLYDGLNLTGSFDTPTEYTATIYSYENVDITEDGAYLPALEIKYTMDDLQFTHTVKFLDSTDETGKTPLALKRNYLYRIVLTKPLDVAFNVVVDDWNTAEAFQIDELPFDKHDQAALNAQLKVNMFTKYNVLTLDKQSKKVTFFNDVVTESADCPATSYFTYNWLAGKEDGTYSSNGENLDVDLRNQILLDDDNNQYRIPTEGENQLLLPIYTDAALRPHVDETGKWLAAADGSGNGVMYPYWNDNAASNVTGIRIIETDQEGNDYFFQETAYLENEADGTAKQSGSTVSGQSCLRRGAFIGEISGNGKIYNAYRIYAIRFKGSSEYAAYCYESKSLNGDPQKRCLSIKIKALPSDSKLTIDDITDNDSFWNDGYLEFIFPGSGFYTQVKPEDDNDLSSLRGISAYAWSSTMEKSGDRGYYLFMNFEATGGGYRTASDYSYPLRLVKVVEQ